MVTMASRNAESGRARRVNGDVSLTCAGKASRLLRLIGGKRSSRGMRVRLHARVLGRHLRPPARDRASLLEDTAIGQEVSGPRKALAVLTAVEQTSGMRNTEFDFTKLSIAERIQLAEDLWGQHPPEGADLPLTEAQKAELDRRLGSRTRS